VLLGLMGLNAAPRCLVQLLVLTQQNENTDGTLVIVDGLDQTNQDGGGRRQCHGHTGVT